MLIVLREDIQNALRVLLAGFAIPDQREFAEISTGAIVKAAREILAKGGKARTAAPF